jgi:hypothetical protein
MEATLVTRLTYLRVQVVTDDQVRNQIIDLLGGETGKNYFGRMKYCLGLCLLCGGTRFDLARVTMISPL